MHYDIIGDVHGAATKLEALLGELGYGTDAAGTYRHPDRTAVFVGDLIDRGDEQLRTLELVKAMVDAGSARIVMGNHEFNAIGWATRHPDTGEPLRKHSPGNRRQHNEFLQQLTDEQQAHYIEWFTTIPLWLDLGGIRVVHACWHDESIAAVRDATGSDRLSTIDHIVEANTKGSPLYKAVETLLKGPEIPLRDHGMVPYWDHESNKERTDARIRWWNHQLSRLPDLAVLDEARLENGGEYPQYRPEEVEPVKPEYRSYVYTRDIPLFYGHYSRQWAPVHLEHWTAYTACVDFGAAYGGTLVAYRWSGEGEIAVENFRPHDPRLVAPTPSDRPV